MGLFGLFKPKSKLKFKIEMQAYQNGEEVILKDKPVDTAQEEKIRQYIKIRKDIEPYESIMVGFATALKNKQSIDYEIELLSLLIDEYHEIQQKCYERGKEYIDYFNDTWVNIRADALDGAGYIGRYTKRLEYLKRNYATLKAQEEMRSQILPNLEQNILLFVERNQPILQTNIYKAFDASVKEDIKDTLYLLAKNGKLKREKQGNTYLVSIK